LRRSSLNADVDFYRFGAAEAHKLALLNDAQKLGLGFGADGGNFVEENCALVGDFEKTFLRGDGAGEGALHVAEELRFEKIDGNRAGVDGDEGFVCARGSGVNRFGDDFFTGAAFAAEQNGGARRRDLCDEVEHGLHLVALADDVWKVVALLQGALELNVFVAEAAAFDRERDRGDEFVIGPRLGDEILRAAFECGASHIDGAEGGDQDDGELRIARANFAQQFDAVAAGQAYVKKQKIERAILEFLKACFAIFGERNVEAFRSQEGFEAFADFDLVVNDEDCALRHGPVSWLREIRAGRMCPCPAWSGRQLCPRVL
jgi:hypothetical protein